MEAEVVPPSRLRHGVPEELETICLKCLDRDPARRYASAEELADDLKRYQENQPIRAQRVSRIRRAFQWARHQPLAAALVGLSLILVITLVTASSVYSLHLRDANRQLQRQFSLETGMKIRTDRYKTEELAWSRRWYGAQLYQVKHTVDDGQIELANELFEELEQNLSKEQKNGFEVERGFEWRYLDRLTHLSTWQLEGHQRPGELPGDLAGRSRSRERRRRRQAAGLGLLPANSQRPSKPAGQSGGRGRAGERRSGPSHHPGQSEPT